MKAGSCCMQVAQCLDWIGKQGTRRLRAHALQAQAAQQTKLRSKHPAPREMSSVTLLRSMQTDAAPSESQATIRPAADSPAALGPFPDARPAYGSETVASEGASVDASGRAGPPSLLVVAERRAEMTEASPADAAEESDSLVRPKKALPLDALPPAPLLRSDASLVPRLDTRQRSSARAAADGGAAAAAESSVGVALLSKPVKLAFRGAAAAAAAAAGLLEEPGSSSRRSTGGEQPPVDAAGAGAAGPSGDGAAGGGGGGGGAPEGPQQRATAEVLKAAKPAVEAPKVSRRLMERGARRIRGELLQNEEPVRICLPVSLGLALPLDCSRLLASHTSCLRVYERRWRAGHSHEEWYVLACVFPLVQAGLRGLARRWWVCLFRSLDCLEVYVARCTS